MLNETLPSANLYTYVVADFLGVLAAFAGAVCLGMIAAGTLPRTSGPIKIGWSLLLVGCTMRLLLLFAGSP